jgi:hypothetical protein
MCAMQAIGYTAQALAKPVPEPQASAKEVR